MIKLLIILIIVLLATYAVLPARYFALGKGMTRRFLDRMLSQSGGESRDPAARALVERTARRLSESAGDAMPAIEYRVVRTRTPNAFAVGGHYICVTEGLIDLVDRREDLLAAVLAHELGHILHGHAARKLKENAFMAGAWILLAVVLRSPMLTQASRLARTLALSNFSQSKEHEADAAALWLLDWADYDPARLATALRAIDAWHQENGGSGPAMLTRFFSSHPPVADRVARIERLAADIKAGRA